MGRWRDLLAWFWILPVAILTWFVSIVLMLLVEREERQFEKKKQTGL